MPQSAETNYGLEMLTCQTANYCLGQPKMWTQKWLIPNQVCLIPGPLLLTVPVLLRAGCMPADVPSRDQNHTVTTTIVINSIVLVSWHRFHYVAGWPRSAVQPMLTLNLQASCLGLLGALIGKGLYIRLTGINPHVIMILKDEWHCPIVQKKKLRHKLNMKRCLQPNLRIQVQALVPTQWKERPNHTPLTSIYIPCYTLHTQE